MVVRDSGRSERTKRRMARGVDKDLQAQTSHSDDTVKERVLKSLVFHSYRFCRSSQHPERRRDISKSKRARLTPTL
jgi:hypothetical protein